MNTIPKVSSIVILSLVLASCWRGGDLTEPIVEGDDSSLSVADESSESADAAYSAEVTRSGVIEKLGVSIYMEGSHRLLSDDGTSRLLRSQVINLDDYLNQHVVVIGIERPTVEGDAKIINVSSIASSGGSEPWAEEGLQSSSESSSVVVESSSSVSSKPAPKPALSSSSAKAVQEDAPAASSSAAASSAAASQPADAPEANNAVVNAMAKTSVDPASWTQQYCTTHVGFCVPLHRNWWYKSFGATTTYAWHVEVSSEEIENLGDGPLLINLVSGSLEGGLDSTVSDEGEFVIGYRSWTDNRHFEITAPAVLRPAVDYITRNLTIAETPAP